MTSLNQPIWLKDYHLDNNKFIFLKWCDVINAYEDIQIYNESDNRYKELRKELHIMVCKFDENLIIQKRAY